MVNDYVSSVLKWLLLFLQLVFLIQNADSASIVKYLPVLMARSSLSSKPGLFSLSCCD
ncbi:unnamed protein product [Brassica oleracea var. botrytis]|uniref:(rape) hypothetical protein n=1 Tax=Brassica napus TaxID=3708 RepID=A0A816QRA5_BRANA|nr:unnamed protein product [Brassica napus]